MSDAVLYLPLATTALSAAFTVLVLLRLRRRPGAYHLVWWAAGIAVFGAGTAAEGLTAVLGWHEGLFRWWYITGALLGGAPLAQGTVYLLLPRRTAHLLTAALVLFVAVAAACVLATPLDAVDPDTKRLETSIIEWTWVRAFSPLVNTYAFIFLVGGAAYSARRYWHTDPPRGRGTLLISIGALLPGIGGSFTRAGFTEVLYVTEFAGLLLILWGYRLATRGHPAVAATAPAPGEARSPASAAG